MSANDPWSNPSLRSRRQGPVRNALRSGRQHAGVILVACLCAAALLGLSTGENGFKRIIELREKERVLSAQVAEARERVAKLEFDARDPDRIREREAREEWRMLRPNELLYEIVPGDSLRDGTDEPDSGAEDAVDRDESTP